MNKPQPTFDLRQFQFFSCVLLSSLSSEVIYVMNRLSGPQVSVTTGENLEESATASALQEFTAEQQKNTPPTMGQSRQSSRCRGVLGAALGWEA